MSAKENILDSWIMVEQLSEGDIDTKSLLQFEGFDGKDFYGLFTKELDELKSPNNKNKDSKSDKEKDKDSDNKTDKDSDKEKDKDSEKYGIVMFFDTFKFSDVLGIIQKEDNKPEETYEEIYKDYGTKFRFALYFDENLVLQEDLTFYSVTAFIRKYETVPTSGDFKEFEKNFKSGISKYFPDVVNKDGKVDKESFNTAMRNVIEKYNCSLGNCYFNALENYRYEAATLHSFFTSDLEAAKKIETPNLNAYLFGNQERINLDSKKDSPNFNPEAFKKILEPQNYPLGRYPSKTEFALSLMQQVAVNLAAGYDTGTIRSVNGPPGTGKSTLLYDIFAQLVVQQAIDIVEMPGNKNIKSKLKISHYSTKVYLGDLPDFLAENNIFVASSNNGAVRNIVNELPLISKVDENLLDELKEADYFYELSNKPDKEKKKKDSDDKKDNEGEQLSIKEVPQNDNTQKYKYWGLFSLEGGNSTNTNKMVRKLKGMVEALGEYQPNPGIYSEFKAQYEEVAALRQKAQECALRQATSESDAEPLDMDLEYNDLQLSHPWFTEKYRIAQSKLFIAALKVRKQFLYENRDNLDSAVDIWENRWKDEYKPVVKEAWDWVNFAIPVISSTFASVAYMFKERNKKFIGHLFVDEAGQALPQAAVGAIFRSKHVMVVGDPSQIPPVLTLDSNILGMLRKRFDVTEKYLSPAASAQTLVDAASPYGFYKNYKDLNSWVGIPLWVHRRCADPMFEISNKISYNGMMVQGNPDNTPRNRVCWFDVRGKANDKYVAKQGIFLRKLIQIMSKQNRDIKDPNKKDTIYVISPFKNVARALNIQLKKIPFVSQKPIPVGTIHTFQGKEAPIVFLVLGADKDSKKAAEWAVREPNMMNVAATRAKEEFYIIGDLELYTKIIGGEVISDTYNVIEKYCNKTRAEIDAEVKSVMESDVESPKNHEEISPVDPQSPASLLDLIIDLDKKKRITGTVKNVISKAASKYAYITGDDDVEYTVRESTYSKTKNAETVIKKGKRVSFVIDYETERRIYVKNIKPTDE